ncbi:hypothetical protein LTR66_015330, partial [Elasticomyces elasticus]
MKFAAFRKTKIYTLLPSGDDGAERTDGPGKDSGKSLRDRLRKFVRRDDDAAASGQGPDTMHGNASVPRVDSGFDAGDGKIEIAPVPGQVLIEEQTSACALTRKHAMKRHASSGITRRQTHGEPSLVVDVGESGSRRVSAVSCPANDDHRNWSLEVLVARKPERLLDVVGNRSAAATASGPTMGSPTRIQRKPVAGRPNTNHSQRREHQTQEPQIGGAPDEAVSPVASASKTTDASIAIVGNSTRTTAGDVPIASVSDAPVRAKASKDGPSKLHAADSSLSADRVASPTKRGKQFRPLSSAIEPASNASTTVTAAELAIPSTPLTTANFKGHTAGAEVVRTAEKPTRCAPPPPPQDTHRHRRAERRRTRAACVLQYGVSTPGARLAHGLEAWEQKRKRPHLSSPTGAETPVPRSKEPHQKRKRRPLFDGFVPLLRRDGTDPLLPVPPDVEDVVAVSKEGSVEQPMNGSERLASRVRENTGLASTRQRFLILDTLVPCRTQVAENKAAAEAFRAEEGKIAQVMASPREEADRDMALALQLEMEQEAQTEAAPSKTRECVVCGDSLAIPDFPIFRPTDGCAHDVQTCAGCLSRWIGAELDGK